MTPDPIIFNIERVIGCTMELDDVESILDEFSDRFDFGEHGIDWEVSRILNATQDVAFRCEGWPCKKDASMSYTHVTSYRDSVSRFLEAKLNRLDNAAVCQAYALWAEWCRRRSLNPNTRRRFARELRRSRIVSVDKNDRIHVNLSR